MLIPRPPKNAILGYHLRLSTALRFESTRLRQRIRRVFSVCDFVVAVFITEWHPRENKKSILLAAPSLHLFAAILHLCRRVAILWNNFHDPTLSCIHFFSFHGMAHTYLLHRQNILCMHSKVEVVQIRLIIFITMHSLSEQVSFVIGNECNEDGRASTKNSVLNTY